MCVLCRVEGAFSFLRFLQYNTKFLYQIEQVPNKHKEHTYDEAFGEVVCDACEDFLADPNIQQTILMIAEVDQSIAQKIKNFIKNLINRLDKALRGLKGQSLAAQYTRSLDAESIQKLKDLWVTALVDSRENVLQARKNDAEAQKNTTDEGDVKLQARYAKQGGLYSKALTGAEWTKYNHSITTGMDAGLRISDHSILVECEKGDYTYKLVIYDNQSEDSPIIGVYGIGKNLYNEDISNFDAKTIGEFITNLEDRQYDNKQTLERLLRFYSRDVGYILGRYNSKSGRFNKFGHKVSENARSLRQDTNGTGVSQGVGKTYYQDRDSLGRTLTKAQQSYFADSKIRDENGNLMVMYHGSPKDDISSFRLSLGGAYFTANSDYAREYARDVGKVYEVYLNITKPFDTRNAECRAIFEKEFYGQWGNGAPLGAKGLPDWTDGDDLIEFLQEKGYDYDGLLLDEGGVPVGTGVKDRGISYVVFDKANQVKYTDNLKPTTNEDMKFSMRENVEETKDLIAVHNLSKENLLKSLKLGGLPIGVNVLTYENGNDNSRTDALNSIEDVKFQGRPYNPSLEDLGIDYKAENDKLKADFDRLKEMHKLQGTVTHGKVLAKASYEGVAKKLLHGFGMKRVTDTDLVKELVNRLDSFYSYIIIS